MKMLTRLALKNNKKNKARSILIMLVIFLSTTLLSSIALICYGSLKYQKDNVKELSTELIKAYRKNRLQKCGKEANLRKSENLPYAVKWKVKPQSLCSG